MQFATIQPVTARTDLPVITDEEAAALARAHGAGGIEADLTVTRIEADAFLVVTTPATRFRDFHFLKRAIGDRVAVNHHVACGECVYCRRGNETMCDVFRENLLVPGGFADTILVRPRAVAQAAKRLPDGLSDEAAVFMEPAGCVLRGIRRSGLTADLNNPSAVVMGAGSMGLLHLLVLGAVFPDIPVTVIDPVAERRAMAEKLGAALTAEPGKAALESVMEFTGGTGVDAAFDTVGGSQTLDAGLQLTIA